ncbi:MAG: ferredoxin [Firmicutes bacterium]|uniref:Ferredoxin n=1 Tax=Candidatus Onthovivens merdipullorum TaxID=2840889 RepID=A0A9D9GU60_9BACL|nr:ferredoxin [Candidatus Onthovivens merdipullorum]
MKMYSNREKCIGCRVCIDFYPEAFEMDEFGKAIAIDELPSSKNEDAVEKCLVAAITTSKYYVNR